LPNVRSDKMWEALVTETLILIGPGGNLGEALALRFGREGWRVVLVARNRGKLEAQAKALAAAGVTAEVEVAEASDVTAMQGAVKRAIERHGAPGAVIYNAAAVKRGALADTDMAALAGDFMANCGALVAASQVALPAMAAAGRGALIMTGGGLIHNPREGAFVSLMTGKAALDGFAKCVQAAPEFKAVHICQIIVEAHITPEKGEEIAEVYWGVANEPRDAWRTDLICY